MKRQQVTENQLDLFSAVGEDSVYPYVNSEVVNEAIPLKASQIKEAGEQKRVLAHNLMEAILCQSNISQAYRQVKRNKGVDRMSITDFATWYSTNGEILLAKLRNGAYIPVWITCKTMCLPINFR